jgi:hypothetical protein
MLVTKSLSFLLGESIESIIEFTSVATLVLPSDIPGQESTDKEDKTCSGEIDGVTGKVSRCEVGCVCPCTDDTSDCTETGDKSGCDGSRLWSRDVVETPGEEEWSKGNDTSEAEEASSISQLRVVRCNEKDVALYDEECVTVSFVS